MGFPIELPALFIRSPSGIADSIDADIDADIGGNIGRIAGLVSNCDGESGDVLISRLEPLSSREFRAPMASMRRAIPGGARHVGGDSGGRLNRLSHWIAVAGGLGYMPVAPGTAGSLLGVLAVAALPFAHPVLGPAVAWIGLEWVYLFVTLVLFGVGVWAAGRAEIFFGQHDDGRIVIDEVAGQLITLSPLVFLFSQSASFSPDAPRATTELFPFFSWVVTGFVLFRLFDVWKPGPVRWAERRFEGGLGVMADDAVAGAFGAVVLCGLWALGSELGMTWK